MKKKTSFQIKDLSIERIAELPEGLPEFNRFSPNLNIISGPNGSGKSSTARVIQRIIWNADEQTPVQISARADFGSHSWQFKSRDGIVKQYIDRKESNLSDRLPSAEARDRYLLSLHDLIRSDDEDLARIMVRESNGGYDIGDAKKQLGYSDGIRNKRLTEYKDVREAKEKADEIKKQHLEHKKQERTLTQLYQQKEQIRETETELQFFQRLMEVKSAEMQVNQLKAQEETFPVQMNYFREGDYEFASELEGKKGTLLYDQKSTDRRIDQIKEEFERLQLPEEGIPEEHLLELESYVQDLKDKEREKNGLVAEKKETGEMLRQLKSSLKDVAFVESEEVTIDSSVISEFEQLQLRASELNNEVESLNQLAKTYEQSLSDGDLPSADKLEHALGLLSGWPGKSVLGKKFSITHWIIILTLLIVSVVFTYIDPVFGIGGLVVAIIALCWFGALALRDQKREQAEIKKSIEQVELELPQSWTREEIRQIIDSLITDYQLVKKDERIQSELKRVKEELESKLPKWLEIDNKIDDLLQEAGISPKLNHNDDKLYQSLYWFLKRVSSVTETQMKLESLKSAETEIEHQFESLKTAANEILRSSGFATGENATQIESKSQTLKKRVTRWREFQQELRNQTEKLENLKNEYAEVTKKLELLYDRLKTEDGNLNAIFELHKQKESYDKLIKEISYADKELKAKQTELTSTRSYETLEENVDLEAEDIEEEIQRRNQIIDQKDKVNRKITEIETVVDQLKSQHNLEQALLEYDQTKERLRDRYEDNFRSLAGDVVADELMNEIQFNNQSEMVNRAAELFARITGGKYQLQTATGKETGFYTWDSVRDEPKNLNELSTGTRVQLLLSVRLAFIESQEQHLKLPLLADELLANSDDERAEKIIEALTQISKEGRQIFYFTAQDDEVAKWNSILKKNQEEINISFYQLRGENRHQSKNRLERDEIPLITLSETKSIARKPAAGELLRDFAADLNIPSFNPLSDSISQLHVSYLVDEAEQLYRLLKLGIQSFGAFRYLYEVKTLPQSDFDRLTATDILKRASFIKRYCELVNKGRHKKITRIELEKSGEVSDTFIEEATQLLESLNNDPVEFVSALRSGELKRFRSENIDNLEEWLNDNGFISQTEPLDVNTIDLQMRSAAFQYDISPEKGDELINRIISG